MTTTDGRESSSFFSGEVVNFSFDVQVKRDISEPHYGIILRNRLGVVIFETNTYCMRMATSFAKSNSSININYNFRLDIPVGAYSISIGVSNKGFDIGSFEEYLFLEDDAFVFSVVSNGPPYFAGMVRLYPNISISEKVVNMDVK